MMYKSTTFLLLLIMISSGALLFLSEDNLQAKDYWKDETRQERDIRMAWWREARFGMFIHWGLYAIPAGEWKGKTKYAEWIRHRARIPIETYDEFVSKFNPIKFNAEEWVKMAKQAGMKYIVITSKHHDGFCLWPSKYTDYDIESTPFKRDILGEMTKACKKYNIKMCFYHSIMDWHHPDYLPRRRWERSSRPEKGAVFKRYIQYMKNQLTELIGKYDPAVLWFDGEWEGTWVHDMGKDLYQHVRELKPNIIINNRVDKGRKGMAGTTKEGEFRGDFGTPEQQIPGRGLPGVDWESCITMNRHWGWNKNDQEWKSSKDLIRKLVDIASKGGNFLLNIGPKADGTFPQEAIDRLKDIGMWMEKNSESIYKTGASPFTKLSWGRCTWKKIKNNTRLFLHLFDLPQSGLSSTPKLTVTHFSNEPVKASLLSNPEKQLKMKQIKNGVEISIDRPLDGVDTVVMLDIKGRPRVDLQYIDQDKDGTLRLLAKDADINNREHGKKAIYESDGEKDNIGNWANSRSWVEWTFRITKPGVFQVMVTTSAVKSRAKLQIAMNKDKLNLKIKNTGDYDKYKTQNAGKIKISQPGIYSLSAKPDKKRWKPMNMRSIILKPE